jgi:hypothetical protein
VTGSPPNVLLVQPFPAPGKLVALAYRELDRAAAGSPEQIRALGDARLLPRPWEPATCRTPQLRQQLWSWLDAVVAWLITEYVWEVADAIPACWPQHPHLVHEIAGASRSTPPRRGRVHQRRFGGMASLQPARLHRTDENAAAEPLRGRPPTVAREAATPDTRPRPADAPGRSTMRGTSVL